MAFETEGNLCPLSYRRMYILELILVVVVALLVYLLMYLRSELTALYQRQDDMVMHFVQILKRATDYIVHRCVPREEAAGESPSGAQADDGAGVGVPKGGVAVAEGAVEEAVGVEDPTVVEGPVVTEEPRITEIHTDPLATEVVTGAESTESGLEAVTEELPNPVTPPITPGVPGTTNLPTPLSKTKRRRKPVEEPPAADVVIT